MDAPEHHGHAHHGTGVRWLDLTLALAAFVTSLASIYLAMQHGHDMERLVKANSYPYLQVVSSDLENDFKTEAGRLTLVNQGVGPARIDDVSISIDGKPVRNLAALIDSCCAAGYAAAKHSGALPFAGIGATDVIKSTALSRMIRPGESFDMIDWHVTDANRKAATAFNDQIGRRIKVSICYCSVFDECWVRGYADLKPTPVKACPINPVPYRD